MILSDEEREARRRRAIEQHKKVDPATGKPVFGGNQGGGRPRVPRLQEQVLKKVRAEADAVAAAIIDGLDANQSPHIRLAAAKAAMDLEVAEERRERQEDEDLERRSNQELAILAAQALAALKEAGALEGFPIDPVSDDRQINPPEAIELGLDQVTDDDDFELPPEQEAA